MKQGLFMGTLVTAALLGFGLPAGWADEMHGSAMGERHHEAAARHEGTGHYLRHLLRHSKEIGLTADQITKLKTIQLDLGRTRLRTEAEIGVAELELATLVADDKADLSTIEAKVKQSETLEVGLRMAAIKAKRDAMSLLTPEQREKEKAEHEKMMHQQRMGPMGGSMGPGTMAPGMMSPGMMGGAGHGGPPPKGSAEEHR